MFVLAGKCNEDHPCVGGEKSGSMRISSVILGSPLRMRGKVRRTPSALWQRGITPAYAGKREVAVRTLSVVGDHPCVCGEKQNDKPDAVIPIGSPLRMRGKAISVQDYHRALRITPAYAGKSVNVSFGL